MEQTVNILIVDDEQNVRQSLSDVLAEAGYKAISVGKGNEALQEIRRKPFDVVITDLMLLDINGLELLDKIKKIDAGICVIIITAYGTIETAIEALKKGAYDYITKPFQPEEIIITIGRGIEKERLFIDNIQLRETIATFASAIEAKDPYTRGHSEQVTTYGVVIARELGLSAEDIDNVREAGLLHDIGKIGISEDILLKPGKLTDEEFAEIKKHPQISREILKTVTSLSPILPLVYHHHERYDGRGYPDGLKANQIPLGARILTVADSYQAMISRRAYRKPLTQEEAVKELEAHKDDQFDRNIVDIFLKILDKKLV